ncbi:MAG: carbohydrate kinase [Betaproteobacteria bacterium HGW-Betaproteobacteria-22]|nr:MAG: carbohydrate kinase [Betaproteobacteria bacterium HGW-Betaproteobacteria-22]
MTQENNPSGLSEFTTANKKLIALFGEVLADIFPDRSVLGGAPYNVARHLRAFGMHPLLITRTGADSINAEFMAEMSRLGMDVSGVQLDASYPTGQVLVHLEGNGHRFDIIPDQAYDHIHAGVTHLVTISNHPEMVYFGTLAQRSLESRLALDRFLSDAKSPRFLDMNLRAPWFDKHIIRRSLLRADVLKINDDELKVLSTMFQLPKSSAEAGALALKRKFELDGLIVTCGADGAWALFDGDVVTSVAGVSLDQKMVDTVGAGDGFAAICMIGMLRQWPVDLMLSRANRFAAAICGLRGAAPESPDFYDLYIQEWQ